MSETKENQTGDSNQYNPHVFWGEIAPADHLVKIYESDEILLHSLEGFANAGFKAGEAVIIIATKEHVNFLNERLNKLGYNLEELKASNQYMALDVNETLATFMRVGWPDEQLFTKTVKGILALAKGENKRHIRVYGEMVAVLWQRGYNGATVQLEKLWSNFCAAEAFSLFCTYPKSGFEKDDSRAIEHICSTHNLIIGGLEKAKTEFFYKNAQPKKLSVG